MPVPTHRRLSRVTLVFLLVGLMPAALWAVTPLKTVPVGRNPGPIVVNPTTHSVYIVNRSDNTVSILDSERLTVKSVVRIGSGASAIAANPAANLVYVANSGAGSITAILGTQAVGTVTIGGTPVALVVDATLNQLYIADAARNQVLIYNATTGAHLATLPTAAQPTAMALNLATHSVFVSCTGASGSVVVIDGTHNHILTTVGSLPTGMTSISVDPVTNVATSVSPTANVYTVIDAANGYSVVEEPGDTGADPLATAYDPGGDGLFLSADTGDGNIFFADGSGIITLGNAYQTHLGGANALAVNPTTNQMGLVYPAGDAAYIIDLDNPLYFGFYHLETTGVTPTALAFDPLTNRVFVTNAGDNTVSVFDITPGTEVPAYEGAFGGNSIGYNYIDANPATGTTYTLRLGNLYAINEAQAGAGANGLPNDTAGVTAIPLGSIYSQCVAVNSATNKIYVGDYQGLFYSVNGATNVATLISSVPPTADIRNLAVDSATNQILAWDYTGDSLLVLDSSTDSLLRTIPLTPAALTWTLVDPAKNLAYFVSSSVFVVDPATGTVVATIPLSGQTMAAALNPATHRLYVGVSGFHLYVIDTSQNSVVTTVTLPSYELLSIGVNPLTGNYYVGMNPGDAVIHVLVYSGASNTLLSDLTQAVYPILTDAVDIKANPLTNQMYVGSDRGTTTSAVAVIDGLTSTVSALAPSPYDTTAHALAVDLGTGLLAGAGYSYTTLWFPSSDVSGGAAVPIAVALQGVPDGLTIATKPIFRTRNTTPSFYIAATSNFSGSATALVPKQAFYQVDGWQGTWTATALVPENNVTSYAKVKLPKLSTGRHILYAYAGIGDIATVQASASGGNSPVISPMGSVVFTVEK
jgi:DNA-binding beta-propeller fold protein YncE